MVQRKYTPLYEKSLKKTKIAPMETTGCLKWTKVAIYVFKHHIKNKLFSNSILFYSILLS